MPLHCWVWREKWVGGIGVEGSTAKWDLFEGNDDLGDLAVREVVSELASRLFGGRTSYIR